MGVARPHDLDARRRWEAAQNPPPPPHPAPEVRATVIDVPPAGGACIVVKKARDAGWTVVITYARGTSMDSKGHPGCIIESVAVRAQRGLARFVVTWSRPPGGTWTVGTCWAWGHAPVRKLSLRDELSAYLINEEVAA